MKEEVAGPGQISILNVFGGDTKLVFDKENIVETIRAKRIVKDMLRRGYMLCVEDKDGKYVRATDFDENTGEYIIADFSPESGDDDGGQGREETQEGTTETATGQGKKKRGRQRRVSAETSKAISVPRVAGG